MVESVADGVRKFKSKTPDKCVMHLSGECLFRGIDPKLLNYRRESAYLKRYHKMMWFANIIFTPPQIRRAALLRLWCKPPPRLEYQQSAPNNASYHSRKYTPHIC